MTGILPDLPASEYHEDRVADVPSLSASIAKLLIAQSPLHAYTAHPRLNPYFVPKEDDEKYAVGTAAHAALLEGVDVVEVCDFDSWRSGDAKLAKKAAYAAGKVPLLQHKYFDMLAMVDAAKVQLGAHEADPPLFTEGTAEVTLRFALDGVACRSRLDWLRDDHRTIDDLKTSARSARPEDFAKTLYGVGNDVSAAFYLRGLAAVRAKQGLPPIATEFRWVAIETSPPFALSVVTPGPDVLALADDKVTYALNLWKTCLDSGSWPAYDKRVATAELPGWEETRWLERTLAA